ncbi:hypothetical protein [Pendulispora albinea]|uniref:Uncharacterized protein n=1 Tax=Pendulispora albinea TaxID=2741071 RepID=A0ABZ2LKC9_9BACT
MKSNQKKSRIVIGAVLCAAAAGAFMARPSRAQASVEAGPTEEDFLARGCSLRKQKIIQGRHLNLWACDINSYHGQIASARAGDSVWASFAPGEKFYVQAGNTFVNTRDYQSLPTVCGRIADTGFSDCTD